MTRRRVAVVVAILAAICLIGGVSAVLLVTSATGLFGTVTTAIADDTDGDVAAERQVRATAADLTSSIGYVQRSVDAETRAATTFTQPSGAVRLTPLVWNGSGSVDDPAVVDVRIDVELAAIPIVNIGDRGRSAGSAVGCYRFTVAVTREASSERIECPAVAAPTATPVASVPPELPGDAEERVRAVLAEPGVSVAEALRAAFPDPATTIESVVTDAGETVAAVGVPAARDCVVLVRRTDGSIDPVSFRRISLEQGEVGCSTSLYTAPPF